MSIKINSIKLKKILDTTPPEQNIMLTGKHGIGKSQILNNYFTAKGSKVVILFLGQMSDPGDLIGLPHFNEKTGQTDFMLPYWFPTDNKPVVLFLDELNRARPEILQTIMDLALNRTLAGKKLPEGSRIISAVNDGEEYQLTDLDPSLVSRFNIYEFKSTVQEWLLWATQKKLDSRVIDFISENPDMLDGKDFTREDQGLEKTPDRRGWERVSVVMQGKNPDVFLKKICAGIIGFPVAADFYASLSQNRLLSAKEILLSTFSKVENTLKKYTTPNFATVNDSLFRFLETSTDEETDSAKVSNNLCAYFDYLISENLREAAAHFANTYSSSSYPKALTFIITKCPNIYKKITEFIGSL